MISLFNIPNYVINTSVFSNKINDNCVGEFEHKFASYVGAKYACGISSATNAIFLTFLNKKQEISVPSMIPPVVINSLVNAGNKIRFKDDVSWVGDSYILHKFKNYKVIDSAQKVSKDQFLKEANDEDLMIFSFYPTKPVGSLDGGMIVSNDKNKIDWFKKAVMNGMGYEKNSWDRKVYFPGWKMYLSSYQAFIANKNLDKLMGKQKRLSDIRNKYNNELCYSNTSDHLYRINVKERINFIQNLKINKISTGIHYSASHKIDAYKEYLVGEPHMPITESEELTTVSIPFHENLTNDEVTYIIKCCKETGKLCK
tara:strand:- start:4476 stop:5414 length:939 start_codon:yes stop_codon:yes gene_type:complete